MAHISTGEIIREHISKKTLMGKAMQSYIDKGALVPDSFVLKLLKERIQNEDCKNGFILDGFPRTIEQAKELEKICKIDACFYLAVNTEIVVARMLGRLTCANCGLITHKKWTNSTVCPNCKGKLECRNDDNEILIKERIKNYNDFTSPLIDYYREEGLLYTFDSTLEPDDTLKQAEFVIKEML